MLDTKGDGTLYCEHSNHKYKMETILQNLDIYSYTHPANNNPQKGYPWCEMEKHLTRCLNP